MNKVFHIKEFAARVALKAYAAEHPAKADRKALEEDMEGFIQDLINDLQSVCETERLSFSRIVMRAMDAHDLEEFL